MFFIDKDTPDANAANNVFIATREQRGETVTSAQSARLEIRSGERIVLLRNGQRLETAPDKPGLRISEFAEYGTRIGQAQAADQGAGSTKTATTLALAVSFGAGILFVEQLNAIQFFGFPLGFWFAQQGSIYVFVLMIFFYVWKMNQLDRKYDLHEE